MFNFLIRKKDNTNENAVLNSLQGSILHLFEILQNIFHNENCYICTTIYNFVMFLCGKSLLLHQILQFFVKSMLISVYLSTII